MAGSELEKKDRKEKTLSPLSWLGGKKWLSHMVEAFTPDHQQYVEAFAGAAHILFGKKPAPVEVINDLDSGLYNFYQVIRNPISFDQFKLRLELTPYSREEFEESKKNWKNYDNPVEKACAWFVTRRQAINGMDTAGWSLETCKSNKGASGAVARYLGSVERLQDVHERLRGVQVENRDFQYILRKYDKPGTWFYVDPPYVHDTRSSGQYVHEMEDEDHVDLVEALLRVESMVLLSGYDNDIYHALEVAGWRIIIIRMYAQAAHGYKEEFLWFSPNLLESLWQAGKCSELKNNKIWRIDKKNKSAEARPYCEI